MKRAVIYARYSSDNQRAESIDAQVRICTAYCQRNGYVVVKTYKDEALTGTSTTKRQNYKALLADARKGMFDIIVFHKIDRNARNEYDYYLFKYNMQMAGVEYRYAEQNIDSSAEGQLMENNLVGFAAYYSRNLANEVKKGKKESALKALFPGGMPPLGYDVVDKKYVINEHEAKAVRLIFKMYLIGHGYKKIAEALHLRGFLTKLGKPFGKNSLYSILSNPRYSGTFVVGKVVTLPNGKRNTHSTNPNMFVMKNAIPAIISELDFERARAKMIMNKRKGAQYKSQADYILSGRLYCECGNAYIGNTITAHGMKYYYYRCGCRSSKAQAAIECTNKMIRKEYIEKIVVDALLQRVFACDIEKVIDSTRKKFENEKKENNELKDLFLRRNGLENRLNNLYKILENGVADDYDLARLANLKKELTIIKNKIRELENAPNLSLTKDYLKNMWERYKKYLEKINNGSDEIRTVINNCVKNILVKSESIEISVVLDLYGYAGAASEI